MLWTCSFSETHLGRVRRKNILLSPLSGAVSKRIDNHTIIDFIKEAHFYDQL